MAQSFLFIASLSKNNNCLILGVYEKTKSKTNLRQKLEGFMGLQTNRPFFY